MSSVHTSVLLQESIENLNIKDNSLFVDMTFGGGGHSQAILEKANNVKVIAFDQDAGAWNRALPKINNLQDKIIFKNLNFKDIDQGLQEENIKEVDGVLFDLGISSDQLDNSKRGFSFLKDEDLLMTLKQDLNT